MIEMCDGSGVTIDIPKNNQSWDMYFRCLFRLHDRAFDWEIVDFSILLR